MLGLRPALNQPPPLASPAHTFAILIICLPLKAIQGATSSYVSTFDVDCDGDGDGGSDCMRDGAYKFCALFIFLFLFFFFEWSRNFCAVASGMQPRQQHQQQLQLQNSFGRPAAEAEAECKGGVVSAQRGEIQSRHSGGHNHKQSGVGNFLWSERELRRNSQSYLNYFSPQNCVMSCDVM